MRARECETGLLFQLADGNYDFIYTFYGNAKVFSGEPLFCIGFNELGHKRFLTRHGIIELSYFQLKELT